jgi:hypothetical protein
MFLHKGFAVGSHFSVLVFHFFLVSRRAAVELSLV